MSKQVKPSARGIIDDAAERWLRENDPSYPQVKRTWAAPSTDALCRARSETNEIHPTLEDQSEEVPLGSGAYRKGRRRSLDDLIDSITDEDHADE